VKPLQQAVSFVTRDVLIASGREPSAEPHGLTFRGGRPSRLRCDRKLSLRFDHQYTITEALGELGRWKVSTAEYIYELLDEDARRVIAYHWHPVGRSAATWPHVHLPKGTPFDLAQAHAPTGRISIEAVLRFAIQDLGVEPLRRNWREAMAKSEQLFLRQRSWG
jgi:hypothetical protein